METVFTTLRRTAESDLAIIIFGEPGSGREWAARYVHSLSLRREGPFIPVDCAASVPEQIERELFGREALTWKGIEVQKGAFEEAEGGTLFLHEISALSAVLQQRIARAIEYKLVRRLEGDSEHVLNLRFIASSSNLSTDPPSRQGLHEDFLTRIAGLTVTLPPLRNRRAEIPALMDRFLREIAATSGRLVEGFSPAALEFCCAYQWPGNVRQLKSAIEYAAVMCARGTVQPEHLPAYLLSRDQKARHA